ncbi:unnamed protein product [Linum tenue]|uniref:RNase H type-1 domain-containing protein n=1 Tax=Linum tenue TaxID=586396 RepID=A0AAV0KK98_9ROSI|nr:unnamed protein product [Linum tenue]
MEREKDAFYVVRKGDLVGIYKSFPDCLAQAGCSVSDPSVSVFKGYGLPRDAEDYLASLGLRNAAYSVSATDVQTDLFGNLQPCRIQPPASNKESSSKRSLEASTMSGSNVVKENSTNKYPKLQHSESSRPVPTNSVWRFSEGVGIATNNVAEYRGVLLGMKQALKKGFIDISVQGDSNLVCMQIQGKWKLKNPNIIALGNQAKELKDKFRSFEIRHVLREFNSEADALANQGVQLRGQSYPTLELAPPLLPIIIIFRFLICGASLESLRRWASARGFDHQVVRQHLRFRSKFQIQARNGWG